MLTPATPFPQQGSWALYVDPEDKSGSPFGTTHAVRIVKRRGDEVLISMPARPGSSGVRTVPFAALRDPTPLTDEERKEKNRLNEHLFGLTNPGRSRFKPRFDELRRREADCELLGRLTRKVAA